MNERFAEADAALERAEQKIEAFLNMDECSLVLGILGLLGGAALMLLAASAVAIIVFSLG